MHRCNQHTAANPFSSVQNCRRSSVATIRRICIGRCVRTRIRHPGRLSPRSTVHPEDLCLNRRPPRLLSKRVPEMGQALLATAPAGTHAERGDRSHSILARHSSLFCQYVFHLNCSYSSPLYLQTRRLLGGHYPGATGEGLGVYPCEEFGEGTGLACMEVIYL